MSQKITPTTSRASLKQRLGRSERQALRESDSRRDYLTKVGQWLTGVSVKVKFVEETAYCSPDCSGADYLVGIPSGTIPAQEVTDLTDRQWDLLFQETELMHELGHVLYTDFDASEEYKYQFSKAGHRAIFQSFSNALEDGAIERQLASEFNCREDLRAKNANLFAANQNHFDASDIDVGAVPAMMAIDAAKWDTGNTQEVLDADNDPGLQEALEAAWAAVQDIADDVVSEPDSESRMEKSKRGLEEVTDILEPWLQMSQESGKSPDAMPDDLGEGGMGNDPDPMPAPDEDDGEDDGDEDGGSQGPPLQAGSDPEDPGGQGGEDTDAGENIDEDDLEQHYGSEVERQVNQQAEDDGLDEAGKLCQAVSNTDSDVIWDPKPNPTHRNHPTGDIGQARSRAEVLESDLRSRLQNERASRMQTGQRTGQIDTHSLRKTKRGASRVFKSESEPHAKEYQAVVLLDRSDSMYFYWHDDPTNWLPDAEEAAGSLTWALENVGVDVCQMGFYDGDIRVEKPFSRPVEQCQDTMFSGVSEGGTPLSDGLGIAREMLDGGKKESFVAVVTDGKPNDAVGYEEELEKCDFPVLGAITGDNAELVRDETNHLYNSVVAAPQSLTSSLQQLVTGMMF